jgi:hypothetical protein
MSSRVPEPLSAEVPKVRNHTHHDRRPNPRPDDAPPPRLASVLVLAHAADTDHHEEERDDGVPSLEQWRDEQPDRLVRQGISDAGHSGGRVTTRLPSELVDLGFQQAVLV